MNIKTKLYITSIFLALVTVVLTMAFNNILPQLAPWAVLYLVVLCHLDRIKPVYFWSLFFFCYKAHLLFTAICVLGILSVGGSSAKSSTIPLVAIVDIFIAGVLAATQIPFIIKAIRKNK